MPPSRGLFGVGGVDVRPFRLAGRALEDGHAAGRHPEGEVVVVVDVVDFRRPDRADRACRRSRARASPSRRPSRCSRPAPGRSRFEVGRPPEFDAVVVVPDVVAGGAGQVVVAVAAEDDVRVPHVDVVDGLDGGQDAGQLRRPVEFPIVHPGLPRAADAGARVQDFLDVFFRELLRAVDLYVALPGERARKRPRPPRVNVSGETEEEGLFRQLTPVDFLFQAICFRTEARRGG